jgi:acid ceramidase
VNLDLPPKERFVPAYAPFSTQMQKTIAEVRQAIGSFGMVAVKFMEVFIGNALESLFPDEYLKEIMGISRATNTSMADLALLNAFYELTRFCTSILAKDTNGHLLHGRNLDFGQFFGGWNPRTHDWRLTESLKKVCL